MNLARFKNLKNKLGRVKWNVNIRTRYAHGEGVAIYLARYVKGGPLKNSQIQEVTDSHVTYQYYDHHSKLPTHITLTHAKFIRRYLNHVPEPGRQTIRSYGLYAACNGKQLDQARVLFNQAPVEKPEPLTALEYHARLNPGESPVCALCGAPIRYVVQIPGDLPGTHDPPGADLVPRAA